MCLPNIIIGWSIFNQLGDALSIFYLCMKYPDSDGQVGVNQGDQEITIKGYMESQKLKKVRTKGVNVVDMKMDEKLPKEAHIDRVSTTLEQDNMKDTWKDLLENDDC